MKVRAGTSGYAYKEWKGSFYPADLKSDAFLPYYAEHFDTVEINNTFYRMPTTTLLEQWAAQVPASFCFVLKAPMRLTHRKRLKECGEDLKFFVDTARSLGGQLGPTLIQLPPNMKKDLPRLQDFLTLLPQGWRAAFEFRHQSWFDDDIYSLLRQHDAALVAAETDPEETPLDVPFVPTASWGYMRLRRKAYEPGALLEWAKRITSTAWDDAFVFFKHEDEGTGPRLAAEFLRILKS
ncbi:MAG TPA: DUF72 domain-containing protein [Gemmatimonadales bacterium]|jgi:uncharacterized protein YecE (DUF72 family)